MTVDQQLICELSYRSLLFSLVLYRNVQCNVLNKLSKETDLTWLKCFQGWSWYLFWQWILLWSWTSSYENRMTIHFPERLFFFFFKCFIIILFSNKLHFTRSLQQQFVLSCGSKTFISFIFDLEGFGLTIPGTVYLSCFTRHQSVLLHKYASSFSKSWLRSLIAFCWLKPSKN